MHLYTYPSAPNPLRLHRFLDYKGIELPTTEIDMRENEHRGEGYLRINPLGTLPALATDDGPLLTEVVAICTYLEALHPERPLLGRDPLERALVLNWVHRIFASVMEAFAEVLRNRSPAFENRALPGPIDVEQIPALVDRGRRRWRASMQQFDGELGDRPFLCGDQVTLADSDLLVCLDVSSWIKESLPEDCANLTRWRERTRSALGIAPG